MKIQFDELDRLKTFVKKINMWTGLGTFNACQESSDSCFDERDKIVIQYKRYLTNLLKRYGYDHNEYAIDIDGEIILKGKITR